MEKTGFLLINKPLNYSSFDCIRHIKKILKKKMKIGHTGTLDNFATGLLILAIGRKSTKKINNFLNKDKEYVATGKIGELTDTLDLTGKIIQCNINKPSKIKLLQVLQNFSSNYRQIPPIYSALKFKGKCIYKLAREKKLPQKKLLEIAQKKARNISIYEINLTHYNFPFFTIKTKVSKGTYIRSLMNDIAKQTGSCATCYALKRTKIGNISLNKAINLKKLKSIQDIESNLLINI